MIQPQFILPAIALCSTLALVAKEKDAGKPLATDELASESAGDFIESPTRAGGNAEQPATDELADVTGDETSPSAEASADHCNGDAAAETETVQEKNPPERIEEQPPEDPEPGLTVRVEKLRDGDRAVDPAKVRVLAPFPAKLLAHSPEGWRIETSESAPPFTREVELAPGKHISLTVRPHVLVPDANGEDVFSIAEPGYSAALGYQQDATVAAILANSIHQLDKDAAELGEAIGQLQQLLVSLPKTEVAPEPPKHPTSNPKRQR